MKPTRRAPASGVNITRTKGGHSVRIRCGAGRNPRFTIALHDPDAARVRATSMTELARMLVEAGRADKAPELLRLAGEQLDGTVVDGMVDLAAKDLATARAAKDNTQRTPAPAPAQVTFKDLAQRWTSGKLASEFPDHVKAKADAETDRQRLAKLYPSLGHIALRDFTVADAKRGMAAVPEGRLPSTRRHYAQLISRVMGLAAWPCELIERSPLPRGFLPKVGKRPAFDYLRPAEDQRLLSCTLIPFEARLLYGVLAREGMRLGEARRLLWRHLDLERGVLRLDVSKNGVPRVWALEPSVARALKRLGKDKSPDAFVFEGIERKAATLFRWHLRAAGVHRAELFERTPQRRPIRVHDLRATFITVGLAEGRTEAWICDRTGHRSSQMVNAYRRAARMATELGLGAREGSNLHALRRWNLNPVRLPIPPLARVVSRSPNAVRRRARGNRRLVALARENVSEFAAPRAFRRHFAHPRGSGRKVG